jgi:predicted transcriptional regulator
MTTFTRLFPFLDTVVVDKYKILHDSDAGSANLKKIYKVEIEGLKQFSNLIAKLLQERKVDLSKLKDVCNNPYNTLSVVECLDLKLVDNVFDTARDITTMLDVVFSAEEQIASNRAEDSISSRRPTVSQDSQQN